MSRTEAMPAYPDSLLIIGAGRWARVIIGELCRIVPPHVGLTVHSRHHGESAASWLGESGLDSRVHLSTGWPPPPCHGASTAVIIANAARDHAWAVEWALSQGAAVLVEKPIAPSPDAAQGLADLAKRHGARLAAAHVFLFARYMDEFAQCLRSAGRLSSLAVDWADPATEVRYGAVKRYDPGLPVYADWLPHVIPIIGTLVGSLPDTCLSTEISRGGAAVQVALKAGGTDCRVFMERNSGQRRRIIRAVAAEAACELDFSIEPGMIRRGTAVTAADARWGHDHGPLASMLLAFMRWAKEGVPDPRLAIEPGLCSSRIIHEVRRPYRAWQRRWLAGRLREGGIVDADLAYAVTELLETDDAHQSAIPSQSADPAV